MNKLAFSRVPAKISHPIIWTLCSFILAMLTWSCIGELDVVTTARGRVISDGQIKSVQSSVSSAVRKINVVEGDIVKGGAILIELDASMFEADLIASGEKVSQLQAELTRLEAELIGATPTYTANSRAPSDMDRNNAQLAVHQSRDLSHRQRVREFQAVLESRRAALSTGISTANGLDKRLLIAKEKEERARPYVDLAVPRFQYLQWQDDVLVIEKELATQRQVNDRLIRDIEEAQQRLFQVSSSKKEEINNEISLKRSALRQAQAELDKARKKVADSVVRAPQDGVVQKLNVTTLGSNVSPSDVLLQIVPANTALVIEVLVPNEERGFIRHGQLVDIKLDAFPFQKYGRMNGRLDWLSPDAELSTTSGISLLTQSAQLRTLNSHVPQYMYRAKIIPILDSNKKLPLSPGLTAQIDIYTDKRRIIDFFLFPIRESAEDAIRVR